MFILPNPFRSHMSLCLVLLFSFLMWSQRYARNFSLTYIIMFWFNLLALNAALLPKKRQQMGTEWKQVLDHKRSRCRCAYRVREDWRRCWAKGHYCVYRGEGMFCVLSRTRSCCAKGCYRVHCWEGVILCLRMCAHVCSRACIHLHVCACWRPMPPLELRTLLRY